MAINTSGGSDETGESALRRSFNARTDSSSDLISASIVCCKPSREIAWPGSITWNGVQDGVTDEAVEIDSDWFLSQRLSLFTQLLHR